ncbi:translation initiation factor IF-2 [Scatolibacter rhodanostii]|uniref:translation initiation factor IF-2 n=1 Tax=Scatolibacter rhodanostii TaxID=2014781 RepID=UPI000C081E42|nr:translation initiation factor IF-2 [Scatolibacter rhodanostii]
MMMKYRVREVAKDLGISNKEVIDLLAQYFPEPKKYMTALESEELNIIFEHFTQKNNQKDFNAYFAQKDLPKEDAKKTEQPIEEQQAKSAKAETPVVKEQKVEKAAEQTDKKEVPAATKQQAPQPQNQNMKNEADKKLQAESKKEVPVKIEKPEAKEVKANVDTRPKKDQKPKHAPREQTQTVRPNAAPITEKVSVTTEQVQKSERRVVDTRQSNVNIDKYNEKYDQLADQKVNKPDHTVTKQKFTNRNSQRRGNQRRGRRETESERLNRIAMERKAKQITIEVPEEITVGEFALRLKVTAAEVIKKLMGLGVFASINDAIDFDTATLVAEEFHAKVEKEVIVTIEDRIIDDSEDDDSNLVTRAPIVVVMGHVDHGKTSILDAIRHANVTSGEAGGITQHIGAYRVKAGDRDITFLDTPGHAAFTTMRARGAQVTDIAVLVVAADDGIMPQTIEAINHAKAAGVSIIVAINKMDKPSANPERIKEQLTQYELIAEDWGGDTPCIPVSAHTKEGIDDLLEMITLIADMKELKANPDRAAKGTVVEARLDKSLGPIATVIVQNGTLRIGDILVAGTTVGRVRVMKNDKGERVQEAGPSVPVELTGLGEVPTGGDVFNVVTDERLARELVEQRQTVQKEEHFNAQTKVTLDNLFDQMKIGEMKELKIIVKADVQGSVEAVRQSLEKLTNEEVRVNIIHGAVGAVNESDVMLANASNAIIVGFNVRPDAVAEDNAKRDGVDMRMYRIIYDCIEEIESAMKGMLAPKFREVALGKAECREVYKISNVGVVIGSYILSGKIPRHAQIRVVRDGIIVADDKVASLRRFKDDVKEVAEGYECGICLEKFSDIKTGDILEAYEMQEYRES